MVWCGRNTRGIRYCGRQFDGKKENQENGWIRTEKAERGGRSVLKIEPVKWHEFLTLEEIEEFEKGGFL